MTALELLATSHNRSNYLYFGGGARSSDSGSRQSILVVDDSQASSSLLGELLMTEYDVMIANDGAQALNIALSQLPDLILLDVLLPDLNGYEVLRRLKMDLRTASIPVIFVTGLQRSEDEVRSLSEGAADFISKPFAPTVVFARVAAQLRLARLVAHLENLANVDGLTGISNRRQFDEVGDRELRRAQRNKTPMSVALIDIDLFKQYNDFYGHIAGDAALCAVARSLRSQLKRPGDLVARYGGEEFGLVMPETAANRLMGLANALCVAVRSLAIPHEASAIAPVLTISIGVTSTEEHLGSIDFKTILSAADARLYEAKREGRNRAVGQRTVN